MIKELPRNGTSLDVQGCARQLNSCIAGDQAGNSPILQHAYCYEPKPVKWRRVIEQMNSVCKIGNQEKAYLSTRLVCLESKMLPSLDLTQYDRTARERGLGGYVD